MKSSRLLTAAKRVASLHLYLEHAYNNCHCSFRALSSLASSCGAQLGLRELATACTDASAGRAAATQADSANYLGVGTLSG